MTVIEARKINKESSKMSEFQKVTKVTKNQVKKPIYYAMSIKGHGCFIPIIHAKSSKIDEGFNAYQVKKIGNVTKNSKFVVVHKNNNTFDEIEIKPASVEKISNYEITTDTEIYALSEDEKKNLINRDLSIMLRMASKFLSFTSIICDCNATRTDDCVAFKSYKYMSNVFEYAVNSHKATGYANCEQCGSDKFETTFCKVCSKFICFDCGKPCVKCERIFCTGQKSSHNEARNGDKELFIEKCGNCEVFICKACFKFHQNECGTIKHVIERKHKPTGANIPQKLPKPQKSSSSSSTSSVVPKIKPAPPKGKSAWGNPNTQLTETEKLRQEIEKLKLQLVKNEKDEDTSQESQPPRVEKPKKQKKQKAQVHFEQTQTCDQNVVPEKKEHAKKNKQKVQKVEAPNVEAPKAPRTVAPKASVPRPQKPQEIVAGGNITSGNIIQSFDSMADEIRKREKELNDLKEKKEKAILEFSCKRSEEVMMASNKNIFDIMTNIFLANNNAFFGAAQSVEPRSIQAPPQEVPPFGNSNDILTCDWADIVDDPQ